MTQEEIRKANKVLAEMKALPERVIDENPESAKELHGESFWNTKFSKGINSIQERQAKNTVTPVGEFKPQDGDEAMIQDLQGRGIDPSGIDASLLRQWYQRGRYDKITELSKSAFRIKMPEKQVEKPQDFTKRGVVGGEIDTALKTQLESRGKTEEIKKLENIAGQEDFGYQAGKVAKEIFVDPLARATIQPFVEAKAGLEKAAPGGETGQEAIQTPFGEVSPMVIEQGKKGSSGKYVKEAFDVITSTLPVGKFAKTAISKVSKPLAEHVAPFLTNVPKQKYKIAIEAGKEAFDKAVKFVDEPANLAGFGDEVMKSANNIKKAATEAWEIDEKALITTLSNTFKAGVSKIDDAVTKTFGDDGISFLKTKKGYKIDLRGSQFTQNPLAKEIFDRIISVIKEPIKEADQILNKRTALSDILNGIPKTERNIARVARNVVDQVDAVLDNMTDNGLTKLRESYHLKINPAQKFLDAVTDDYNKLSHDKAINFFKQAMSDVKFDKAEILQNIDAVAGTQFAKDVKLMGAANALNKLAPETGKRVLDILSSLAITKLPVVAGLFSPKFWGTTLLKNKAAQSSAKQLYNYVTAIMLQVLLRENIDAVIPDKKPQLPTQE